MTNRKLDASRLYKLARGIIVVLSIIFILWGSYAVYRTVYGDYKPIDAFSYCHNAYNDLEAADTCSLYSFNDRREFENRGYMAIGLGIVLPIVFFGSVGLFKYLFPKTKLLK